MRQNKRGMKKISIFGFSAAALSIFAAAMLGGCCSSNSGGEAQCQEQAVQPLRKIALHSYVYHKCASLEDVVAESKALGADGVVLSNTIKIRALGKKVSPYLSAEEKAYVKKLFKDAGLVIPSYGIGGGFKSEAGARAYFSFCREMSIPIFTWEGNFRDIAAVAKLASEYGVKLAIHHHTAKYNRENEYNNPEALFFRIRDIDNAYAIADNGHWAREGRDAVRGYRTIGGKKLAMLHFKDPSRIGFDSKRDMPLGEGVLNLPEVLKTLDEIGFDGWFVLENESVFDNPSPTMKKGVEYLRSH